uniref:NAD(P)(+)--arginine ADP-ribosyltransferase n=1 Tax=Chromera velia CCMP2878 TaxID=1169474 RepID=A0A0G4HXZ8_9ALVE|eukprot:Cvel_9386.t1-p1 / transcript=Cvel_9386.t1 / gene=Cvel_9386 / organism=Chromera_velia_CCMP2878 / gene_product=hypothetical protein / transcript_product=hypothetical protein / location=Cvel_scaffold539:32589-38977(+) / protein_length=359 / sequence_SO=supercontig / SO=protein_coding / is_pseudo=false
MSPIDYVWAERLRSLIEDTPLKSSLAEAVATLEHLGLDMGMLRSAIKGKGREWKASGILYMSVASGGFGLPATFPLDFAVAIYIYTFGYPAVSTAVNRTMTLKEERSEAGREIGEQLQNALPYIKFLECALEALPDEYRYSGEVRRGVKWVFPSTQVHDPHSHFPKGSSMMWYDFKSTAKDPSVMTRETFCGIRPGPRTIFIIQAKNAFDIEKFSRFQGRESESEVLFRPLTSFRVLNTHKMILDPNEMVVVEKSGFPDIVSLEEIDNQDAMYGSSHTAEDSVQDQEQETKQKRPREQDRDATSSVEQRKKSGLLRVASKISRRELDSDDEDEDDASESSAIVIEDDSEDEDDQALGVQ